MSGLNKVILIGNLGQDPELKYTTNGKALLNFSLATTESYNDSDKQRQEHIEWHKVVVWGKRAEALSKLLSKGGKVYVEGAIRSHKWEDRNGTQQRDIAIHTTNLILLGGHGSQSTSKSKAQHTERFAPNCPPGDVVDELPF